MLSRVADSIYWMTRNIERVDNLARFIDVNLHLNLDLPQDVAGQWDPLVWVTAGNDWFASKYGHANEENVIRFLTFDDEYPHSIISCLRNSRENARSVREILSPEMWEQINTLYLFVNDIAKNGSPLDAPYSFFRRVKLSCHLFWGLMDSTMLHDEGWHFARIGQLIERADKTSRILDIKYFFLLPSINDIGTPFDNIQWSALLKSTSAFEAYRKKIGRIDSRNVARFLIFERDFPRAIDYCLIQAAASLHSISGTATGTFSNPAEKFLGQLLSELAYADIDEIRKAGLHEFLDQLQLQLVAIGDGISDTFFALEPN